MRRIPFALLATAASIIHACAGVPHARAQAAPGTTSVSSSVTGIHQFTTDLDRGGDVEWSSVSFSAGVTRQFTEATSGGISARFGYEDWRFGSTVAFGGQAPWNELHRAGAGVSLSQALSRTLLVYLSPSVEWAYATDADMDDALIYGAVVSAVKVVSPGHVVGLGASVYRQFYSVKVSPFLIVNWKLNDRLKIANALPAGPEGGAGVELRYQMGPGWELAAGGVYRSDRTRLASSGPDAGDIGETGFIPIFARITRKVGAKASFDLYGGAIMKGKLRIKDSSGDEIKSDEFGTAPAIAATFSIKS